MDKQAADEVVVGLVDLVVGQPTGELVEKRKGEKHRSHWDYYLGAAVGLVERAEIVPCWLQDLSEH
jgi:ABC-type thiamine transport system substrate-binding protein